MATDQSPPQSNLILVLAVAAVVTLVSLKFVFDSYFTDMMEDVARDKLATPDEVIALHADEQKRLSTSPAIPIDQAMAQLAGKGRLSSADISPQQSDDRGALVGWQHLHDGEPGAPAAPAGSAGGAAPGAGDAGTTTMPPGPPPGFDAGTGNAVPNATDAGAPKPHVAPPHPPGPREELPPDPHADAPPGGAGQ